MLSSISPQLMFISIRRRSNARSVLPLTQSARDLVRSTESSVGQRSRNCHKHLPHWKCKLSFGLVYPGDC